MANHYKKIGPGLWGGLVYGPRPVAGDKVVLTTRRGKEKTETIAQILSGGDESGWLCSIVPSGRKRAAKEKRAAELKCRAAGERQKSEARHEMAFRPVVALQGEPIKIGHHSEKRHRAILEKSDRDMAKAAAHNDAAKRCDDLAAGIGEQCKRSIYNDDPDAAIKLAARVEFLEAERARLKESRKTGRPLVRQLNADLNPAPVAAWELQNIGAEIRRLKKRQNYLESIGLGNR